MSYLPQVYVCSSYLSDSNYNKWDTMVHGKVIPGCFVVSIIFLALLIVHIWRLKRSTLFGWLNKSSILMLFIFFLFTSIIKIVNPDELKEACKVFGFIIQYSYMSSVFWLSCMSFFMWKAFRKMCPKDIRGQQYRWGFQHPSFKWYALYAWGCPLVVTIVTIVLQEANFKGKEKIVTPGIGNEQCFFDEGKSRLFYFHIINAPILVSNFHS